MTIAVRAEDGYSLVEMVTVMAIMGIVLAGLTQVFTSASKADIDMTNRFDAQQNTRLALDKLRRDVHCADDASPNSPNPWTSQQSTVTLTITKCGGGNVTWCTAAMAGGGGTSRWSLYRQANSSTCSSSSPAVRTATYLTTQTPFTGYAHPSGALASLTVNLPVSVNRTGTGTYRLQDTIFIRNSTRP